MAPGPAPPDARAWSERGHARLLGGDLDGAIADLTQALALEPARHEALMWRALVHTQRRDWDAAIADYDAAIAVAPAIGGAWMGRGMVHVHRGDDRAALADLDAAIARNPTLAPAWWTRGDLHARAGDHARAIADLGQAIALAPRAALYRRRAAAHRAAGDLACALDDERAADERSQ